MTSIAITGTGLFTPAQFITNEELVASFNAYVDAENDLNRDAIARDMPSALAAFVRLARSAASTKTSIAVSRSMDCLRLVDKQSHTDVFISTE